MSYVLDGVPTAIVQLGLSDEVQCPCGWAGNAEDPAALRFHYTHCPQAKVEAAHTQKEETSR